MKKKQRRKQLTCLTCSQFDEGAEIAVVSPDAAGTARAKFFLGLLQDKGHPPPPPLLLLSSLTSNLLKSDQLLTRVLSLPKPYTLNRWRT